ncbi:MAG: ankyrin repeat domain-containing protein [Alphaproteobacteria bacterium]|nr:ankyrin repeat domain-containing protein [Alphaproteobacteria bacterium]
MIKSLTGALAILLASSVCAQASVQDLINGVKSKNLEAVQQLLAAGEDVNAQNEQGNTALHYAIATDNAEMTRLLLNSGANLNAANEKGWTPLKIAEKKNVQNVTAVLAEMQAANEKIAKSNEVNTIAAERQLIQRAAAEVERARDSEKTALAAQEEAETKALILESKLAMLEKTLAEKSKALEDAEKQNQEALKKVEDAQKQVKEAQKAIKAKAEPKPQAQPAKKVAPKVAPKPQPKKPAQPKKIAQPKPTPVKVRIPQPSTFHKGMTDGAEEVIYCLDLLGQGENKHMAQAGAYYAASNGVAEARYQQIVSYATDFYHNADDNALKQRVDACGKVITPNDAVEQNKIIRALNQSLNSRPNSLIAIE